MVLYLKILLLNLILIAGGDDHFCPDGQTKVDGMCVPDTQTEVATTAEAATTGVSSGECFGPGSGVDEAGQCFCDDSVNAMKDPSDADNTICICKPYHLLNDAENECIMCAGPGAFIKNDVCSCHVSKNAVPVRSVFKLTSGWTPNTYYPIRKRLENKSVMTMILNFPNKLAFAIAFLYTTPIGREH